MVGAVDLGRLSVDGKAKRLNAVTLRKITDVSLDDSTPGAFIVAVGDNSYTLLARDEVDAATWVEKLNDARAAIAEGRVGAACRVM